MEKYLCKKDYKSRSGAIYSRGDIYNIRGRFSHFYEVMYGGYICYIDVCIFDDYFEIVDISLVEVDKLFNTIMDGKMYL